MSTPAGPPRFYLRNCHVVTRPYGWCPLVVLAAELRDLAPEVYGDLTPPVAGHWLLDNDVPVRFRRQVEDDEDTPGVSFYDIDAEIRRRGGVRSAHARQKRPR